MQENKTINTEKAKIDWSKAKEGGIFPLPAGAEKYKVKCNIILKNETTFEDKPLQ